MRIPFCFAGDGKCHVITNIEMKEIQGKEILHVAKMEVDFKVAGMRVHLGNLFNGNKVLGKFKNKSTEIRFNTVPRY